MNISVLGAGYVGLSNAIALSKNNSVMLVDINEDKVKLLRAKKSPIQDSLIKEYLSKKNLSLSFNTKLNNLGSTDVILIATPTNFNEKTLSFDTYSIEVIFKELERKKYSKLVVIRSTVPIGFTDSMQKKYPRFRISFFPEFLREGNALEDTLHPSRIICGSNSKMAKDFLKVIKDSAVKKNINTKITSSSEAEAIKLFSNAFLAMRISFFNELDSFAASKKLCAKNIIEGVSMDPRIGNFYNNPSFGYGGYCLPKDTKQLKENFGDIPQRLIKGTIESNKYRKKFIVDEILNKKINKIGIYRLVMKSGSDNWRDSAIIEIIEALKLKHKNVLIYEPLLKKKTFMGIKVEKDFKKFKEWAKLILANRKPHEDINPNNILYCRDIFNSN